MTDHQEREAGISAVDTIKKAITRDLFAISMLERFARVEDWSGFPGGRDRALAVVSRNLGLNEGGPKYPNEELATAYYVMATEELAALAPPPSFIR